MKSLFYSALLVCFCVGSVACGDDGKMNGTWKPVTAQLGGKPFPDAILKTMELAIADGKYMVTVGDMTDEGTVKVLEDQKPPALEIKGTKGPNKDKTFFAIYEYKDGTLRVCYDLSGKSRPKEFKSKPDTLLFLVEYKRQDGQKK